MHRYLKWMCITLCIGLIDPAWGQSCWKKYWQHWIRGQWNMGVGPQYFKPEEFPHSGMWYGTPSRFYPTWAAATASGVTQRVSAGVAIQAVFAYAAEERHRLAPLVKSVYRGQFGKLRLTDPSPKPYSSGIGTSRANERTDLEEDLYLKLIKPILRQGPTHTQDGLAHYEPNAYTTLTGAVIPATFLFLHFHYFRLMHPQARETQMIFSDVIAQLEQIRATQHASDIERQLRLFLYALYGYYNATPYWRGSSSIGRVFFPGFFLAVFGKKMPPLPDAIDVRAMLMSAEDFIQTFLPYFQKPTRTTTAASTY